MVDPQARSDIEQPPLQGVIQLGLRIFPVVVQPLNDAAIKDVPIAQPPRKRGPCASQANCRKPFFELCS
jgi:hypothetical protein